MAEQNNYAADVQCVKSKRLIHGTLDKNDGNGGFVTHDFHRVKITNQLWASTITARYYKGISSSGDNLVIVVEDDTDRR